MARTLHDVSSGVEVGGIDESAQGEERCARDKAQALCIMFYEQRVVSV